MEIVMNATLKAIDLYKELTKEPETKAWLRGDDLNKMDCPHFFTKEDTSSLPACEEKAYKQCNNCPSTIRDNRLEFFRELVRKKLTTKELLEIKENCCKSEEAQTTYDREVEEGLHPAEMTIKEYDAWKKSNR